MDIIKCYECIDRVSIRYLAPGRAFRYNVSHYMKLKNDSEDDKKCICINLDNGIIEHLPKDNFCYVAIKLDFNFDTKNKELIDITNANPGDLIIADTEPCIKSNYNKYYSLITAKEIKYIHSAYIVKEAIKAYQYEKTDVSPSKLINCVNKENSIKLVSPSDIPIGDIFEKDGELMMKVKMHESDTSLRVCYLSLSTGVCFTDVSDKVVIPCELIGNTIPYRYKRG